MATPPRRFSERIGAITITVQTAGMTPQLRNALWNHAQQHIPSDAQNFTNSYKMISGISTNVLRLAVDHVPKSFARDWFFREVYGKLHWAAVYDVLEYLAGLLANTGGKASQRFM